MVALLSNRREALACSSRTLAHAIDQPDQFLLALDQQALRAVFEPGLHVDAVDQEVDATLACKK